MDDDSLQVTGSSIARLRAHILSPVAHPAHPSPSRSRTNHLPNPHAQESKNGNDYPSQIPTSASGSNSGLPSVVQDSEDATHVDLRPRAMNPQTDLATGTQPISQSFYDSLITKNKSTRHAVQDAVTDTQRTYEEGDSGHVDITSSFKTRQEHSEDPPDSQSSDFSSVQSQQALTQFPESQRFKTPATAGKKRTYNGDIIDTPAPVRNPLARDGQPTSSGMLGLSQVFAATQAASSPISNGLPTVPRSDRPSPNIDVQTHLAATTSSSPLLRPITDLRRAATEPASRYVSVRQSQAERERLERLQMLHHLHDVDDVGDDFDEDDSVVARKRRQMEREYKAKQELKSLSSPLMAPQVLPTSSPPKLRSDGQVAVNNVDHSCAESPRLADLAVTEHESSASLSEAETEQNDISVGTERLGQELRDGDEDKENTAVLVPKTGPRHRVHLDRLTAQVDSSPSLRRTDHVSKDLSLPEMQSSEPFRIMDSQPSQSRLRSTDSADAATVTISSVARLVRLENQIHEPEASRMVDEGVDRSHHGPLGSLPRPVVQWPEDEMEADVSGTKSAVDRTQNHTVPETNSEARAGIVNSSSAPNYDRITDKESTMTTKTLFETAPTHVDLSGQLQSSQISSPIHTTPPGQRRRRRMMDISAEPSPRKLYSQPSFDAQAVLQLDEDEEAADMLESSPYRKTTVPRNRINDGSKSRIVTPVESSNPSSEHQAHGFDHTNLQDEDELNSHAAASDHSLDPSQEIIRPGRQGQSLPAPKFGSHPGEQNRSSSAADRTSIFDIQASPQTSNKTGHQLKSRSEDGPPARKKKVGTGTRLSRLDERLKSGPVQTKVPSLVNNTTLDDETGQTGGTVGTNNIQSKLPLEPVVAPNMVLACYKGEPRGYYPARVLSSAVNGGFCIQWQGYDPANVDAYGIKALDLRVGDTIKVLADGFARVPYIIHGFKDKMAELGDAVTDIRGYKTLIISPKQRKSLPSGIIRASKVEVLVASIYLDSNMWSQMKQRNHDFRPMPSLATDSSISTPVLRASTPSTPSTKGRRQTVALWPTANPSTKGMFQDMAFAISYDDASQKNRLTNLIHVNGGTIINDSFHDLLEGDTLQLKSPYADLGFTALLTDRHSRKEKYMQALALGLPCLSGRWIEACVDRNGLQDWQTYLLPAGESAELDNITRSRVLPPISMNDVKLREILALRPNLLEEAMIVVVVGRGKAELKRAPYLFLIRALGAGKIHKVPDVKSAKDLLETEEGKECQWTFVDDKDVTALQTLLDDGTKSSKTSGRAQKKVAPSQARTQCKVAGNELIVQSLVLGKLYEG